MTTDEIKVAAEAIVSARIGKKPDVYADSVINDIVALCEQVREGDAVNDPQLPSWVDPNCGSCGGSGYTSLGGCYVCQKRAAAIRAGDERG